MSVVYKPVSERKTAKEWRNYRIKKKEARAATPKPATTGQKYEALLKLRFEYGFKHGDKVREWSKENLAKELKCLPATLSEVKEGWVPRNAPILGALQGKFSLLGFRWELRERDKWGDLFDIDRPRPVDYFNTPKVDGKGITLFEMLIIPLELVDGYKSSQRVSINQRPGTSAGE